MLLSQLLSRVEVLSHLGPADPDISAIQFDSRKVQRGDLYVAAPGTQVDGHIYIDAVVAVGVAAIVCERLPERCAEGVTYVRVASARLALGLLANAWHGYPSERLTLVGITGTNGKTTTATLLYRLFNNLGHRTGLLSTIRNYAGDEVVPSTHTTGDALQIASLLARMVAAGCTHCFMEVTSHAIHQHRIAGLRYRGGVFTNLSHDHLDYHGTLEAYRDVKKSWFNALPPSAFALVNADDPISGTMVAVTQARRSTYGCAVESDFPLEIRSADAAGMQLVIAGHAVPTRLVGAFNASNLAAVFGVAVLLGEDPEVIAPSLAELDPVEGRMERIDGPAAITAVVDFAHTPDALDKALTTLRESASGRMLICVVGCGGDRDADKRPVMARIAAAGSDRTIFTADNPRSEDPLDILDAMMAGLTPDLVSRVQVIPDRRSAILAACGDAPPGALVLIAGKGHEKYQEVAGDKRPFDDVACAREALRSREG
ncbi:MAG: UDP-N-acetylmuramoyl-L-alanyl-D-glutamate--2,6-diaminopimelate ligase [Sphingomonas sp.]